jgi:hypothetical protein
MEAAKQDYINYRIQKSDEVYQDAKLLAAHEMMILQKLSPPISR